MINCKRTGDVLTVFDECIDDRGEALPAGDVHGGPPAGHGSVRLHGRLVQQGGHDVRVAPGSRHVQRSRTYNVTVLPKQLSSSSSFSLELEFRLVSIYLQPLV